MVHIFSHDNGERNGKNMRGEKERNMEKFLWGHIYSLYIREPSLLTHVIFVTS